MVSAIDASTPWGTPTIPTIDPGLVTANDVATDCPVPTHSSAASTPTPLVSSHGLDRRISTLGDDVCRAEGPGQLLSGWISAQRDDARGPEALGRHDAT